MTQQLPRPDGDDDRAVLERRCRPARRRRRRPAHVRRRLGEVLVDAAASSPRTSSTHALEAQRAAPAAPAPARRRSSSTSASPPSARSPRRSPSALGLSVVDLATVAIAARRRPAAAARGRRAHSASWCSTRTGDRLALAVADPTNVVALDDVRLYTGATELGRRRRDRAASPGPPRPRLVAVRGRRRRRDDARGARRPPRDRRRRPARGADDAPDRPAGRRRSSPTPSAPGASDIHVEPQRDGLRIRYRVDGLLRDVMTVPRSARAARRQPHQDHVRPRHRRAPPAAGRPHPARRRRRDVDARVSTLPTIHGEKVVIRLLARAEQRAAARRRSASTPTQLEALARRCSRAAGAGAHHRPDRAPARPHAVRRASSRS